MEWYLIAYWVCFLTGSVYALISAVLSGFFGGFDGGGDVGDAGDIDIGGHDYGAGGDVAGHGEAFGGDVTSEDIIMGPLSPATLAIFFTTFGGTGIIMTSLFHYGLLVSLPVSLIAGIAVAATVAIIFYHLFTKMQCSSEPHVSEMIGLSGEVNVPIPKEGVGEIIFVCRGNRMSSPARSQGDIDIPRYTAVRIVRMIGNTAYVSPLTAEESTPSGKQPEAVDFKD